MAIVCFGLVVLETMVEVLQVDSQSVLGRIRFNMLGLDQRTIEDQGIGDRYGCYRAGHGGHGGVDCKTGSRLNEPIERIPIEGRRLWR